MKLTAASVEYVDAFLLAQHNEVVAFDIAPCIANKPDCEQY